MLGEGRGPWSPECVTPWTVGLSTDTGCTASVILAANTGRHEDVGRPSVRVFLSGEGINSGVGDGKGGRITMVIIC